MFSSIYVFDWHDGTLHINGLLVAGLVIFLFVPIVMFLVAWWND